MKKFINGVISVFYVLSVITGTVVILPLRVLAHNSGSQVVVTEKKEEAKPTIVSYKYVAQAGDSYTLMARKAIQTYGIKNKVTLSKAKIIAAETWITQAAGSPYLDLNQSVELKESTVKDTIERAQKLSPSEEAAWATYVAGVDFNTNSVGE